MIDDVRTFRSESGFAGGTDAVLSCKSFAARAAGTQVLRMVNLLTSIPGEAADQPLGPLFIVGWLRQDARFDMVRTTPRFQRLLAQLWPPS